MQSKEYESEALKVNLERTRIVKLDLPEDHQWFLKISEDSFGIHQRTKEFLREFHHPYSNMAEVIKLSRNIAL